MIGSKTKRILVAATFAALATLGATTAQAAVCPDNATLSHTFTVDPSPACYAYGEGNINGGAQDPLLAGATVGGNTFNLGATATLISNLLLLDKSDAGGLLSGALTGDVGPNGSNQGSVTIGGSLAGYENFILALKVGSSADPTWSAFYVSGAGTYDYLIDPKQGAGISHVNLYGTTCVPGQPCGGGGSGEEPPTVPVPASLPLLVTALGFVGILRRRARKSA